MNHYSTHTVQKLLPISLFAKSSHENSKLPLKVTHPNQLPHALQSERSHNRAQDTCRNYWTTALDCLHQGRSALTSHHQLSTVEEAFTSKRLVLSIRWLWLSVRGGILLPRLYQPERKTLLPRSVSMETPAILEINLPPPAPPSSDVTVSICLCFSLSLSLCISHFYLTWVCSPSDHFSLFLSHVVHSSVFTNTTKKMHMQLLLF